MFKIKTVELDLEHRDVVDTIDNIKREMLREQMKSHNVLKLFWFLGNYNQIENPITILIWQDSISTVHPGRGRVLAAYLLKQKYIDSILIYNPKSEEYVNQISSNQQYHNNKYLLLQQPDKKSVYQITVENQKKYFVNNISMDRYLGYYLKTFHSQFGFIEWHVGNNLLVSTKPDYQKATKEPTVIKLNKEIDIFDSLREMSDLANGF